MKRIGPIEKLGTTWWFELFDTVDISDAELTTALALEMERFEAKYSRFRTDSELSQLNYTGQFKNPSAEFVSLLRLGIEAYQVTGGVFNMSVGGVLESQGYGQQVRGVKSTPVDLLSALEVTTDEITLAPGVHLDFGGFGKGYLIDHLVHFLQTRYGCTHVLINGGGDMYVVGDAGGEAIPVALKHPLEELLIGTLSLRERGFAASSPYLRRWQGGDGTEYQHLVGPGQPIPVYVTASTAVWADIWSTTLALNTGLLPPVGIEWWWFDVMANSVRKGETAE